MDEKAVCNVCKMEFNDVQELDAHKEMAHQKDPLGIDSDVLDTDDN